MKRAYVTERNERKAVATLAEQLATSDLAGVLFFCSAEYDPQIISESMAERFDCPFFGCTTAGEIGESYRENGIVAVGFPKEHFELAWQFISPLRTYSATNSSTISRSLYRKLSVPFDSSPSNLFAVCLLDGLCVLEEAFVARAYNSLGHIPLVGGSAGDSLAFSNTIVFCNEEFGSKAGLLLLVKTSLDFEIFHFDHFSPTEKGVKITGADPYTRTVYSIDNEPAARRYAEIVGVPESKLGADVFAQNPLMLELGDKYFVRSIREANPDGSLSFLCAVSEGVPLVIGENSLLTDVFAEQANELCAKFSSVHATIGFDCILRRLELQRRSLYNAVEPTLKQLKFVGLSSFGEQFNSVHINHTLTGVMLGKKS